MGGERALWLAGWLLGLDIIGGTERTEGYSSTGGSQDDYAEYK